MFGAVTMTAATDSSSSFSIVARSSEPSAAVGICVTAKPAIAAVAGFVPCAESGTRMRRRVSSSPRSSSARVIIRTPASSPWAPAAGARLTAGSPVASPRPRRSSSSVRSVPCASSAGACGWAFANPASDATRSSTFGLYFIVQEPSGYVPESMP